jgi:hypothetical protein
MAAGVPPPTPAAFAAHAPFAPPAFAVLETLYRILYNSLGFAMGEVLTDTLIDFWGESGQASSYGLENFGRVTTQRGLSRVVQLNLRLDF